MNYKKIVAGLLVISSVIVLGGFISNDIDPIQKIAGQLDKWASNNPVEKVYLQFDKPYYAVGDDIWFKAYITLGSRHQLSALGGTLDVELIDDQDSIKQHIKLPVSNGLTWGDFALPDTLPEGNYRIRAYTQWMRNAGEDYFFDKAISIVNATTNKIFTKTSYTYATSNGQQQVTALINYSDINGTPYAKREVKYSVELDSKNITRGKAITDDQGNISISFEDAHPAQLRSGRITTNIKLDDKYPATKIIPIKATSANVNVQFFPEGGNMVNGISTKIAFKAVGADGLGADIKGTVTDDQNNTIIAFSSTHLGMGVFNIHPQAGRSYHAHITYADGSANTINLPPAIDKGYGLLINNDDPDYVKIKISASQALFDENPNDSISVVGQSGGEILYAAKSKPGSASFSASIPKSRFPSGIVQFTLFSSKGEPLSERLVFIQNADQLKLDVSSAKQTYSPREKVKINLNAQNNKAQPVVGSFSVAVVDETKVPFDESDESTILSNLLLTSDLRGYIEKPNYYFTNVSATTQADLDVLMLTQGYHRFEWKQILADNFQPVTHQPEKVLQISGHITTLGGKPIAHGKVTLLSTTGGLFYLDTVTDAQGKFTFSNLLFRDSVKFVVQARTDKNHSNVQIDLDNVAPQQVSQNKNAPAFQVSINDGLSAYLLSSKNLYNEQLKYGLGNHVIALKEVVIADRRTRILKNSSNLNGPGNADQVITADELVGCSTLEQCLNGKLMGVLFRNGIPYSTRSMNIAMQVYLDGVPMQSDFLNTINMDDIGSIEVLRTIGYLAIYGGQASGGALLITSKRGGDGILYNSPAPGIITYGPKGYYKSRVFYSPQYDDPKTNTALADLRSTIYWNPSVITTKDGIASMEYFNAGSKGTYRVIIEGIDNDGNIGRQVYNYKVE